MVFAAAAKVVALFVVVVVEINVVAVAAEIAVVAVAEIAVVEQLEAEDYYAAGQGGE